MVFDTIKDSHFRMIRASEPKTVKWDEQLFKKRLATRR